MDLRNLPTEAGKTDTEVLIPREISLTINYKSPSNEQFSEVLRSRIPDGDGRMQIDRRIAILAGVPWSQLSEYAQARITALAMISVYLVDMPEWVNTWAQEDDELLFTLREEVERHNLAWFRSAMGSSENTETVSRVSVSPSHSASINAVK